MQAKEGELRQSRGNLPLLSLEAGQCLDLGVVESTVKKMYFNRNKLVPENHLARAMASCIVASHQCINRSSVHLRTQRTWRKPYYFLRVSGKRNLLFSVRAWRQVTCEIDLFPPEAIGKLTKGDDANKHTTEEKGAGRTDFVRSAGN